jgi:hypothetical protein
MIRRVGPCFEGQLLRQTVPFTPEQRAGIFKELREQYLDHGVPFEKGVRALANDLGWHPEAIIQAIAGPKTAVNLRRFTGGVWKREAVRRGAVTTAKSLIEGANQGRAIKAIDDIWNAQRSLSVTGHYGVFPGTHLKESLFIPTEWPQFFKAYANALKLTRPEYSAFHEYQRFAMESMSSYGPAIKAGLDVKLGEQGFNSGPKFKIGKFELGGRAGAAFDFIKRARLEIFDRWASNMPADQQKIIASFINHATGSVKLSRGVGSWLGRFLFAPKLKPAQLATAYVDPVKTIGYYAKGKNATVGEKAARSFVFRRMGQLAAMQTALLGANYVAGKLSGNENWMPNLKDPNKANFLRVKIAGHSVITSPTLEWLKFPVRMLYHVASGHDVAGTIGKDVLQQFLYQSNPVIGNVWNVLFGEDPVSHKALPFKGAITSPSAKKQKDAMGWTEFLGQKLPIPVASGLHEMYDSMRQEGVDHPTAKSWIDFATGAITAQTGYHAKPEAPPGKAYKPHQKKPSEQGWIQDLMR